MKKLLTLSLLLINMMVMAQMQDLVKMSSGKLVNFAPIYKNEKLDEFASVNKIWGYYAIYELEKIEKDKRKMEYVLMDKNLNKFANGEFVGYLMHALGHDYSSDYSIYLDQKTNTAILLASSYSFTYFYDIDLKNNSLSKPYLNNDGRKKTVEIDSFRKLVVANYKADMKSYKAGAEEKTYETIDSLNYMTYNLKRNDKKVQYIESISYHNSKDSSLVWTKPLNLKAEEKKIKERTIYHYTFLADNENSLIFYKTVERNDIKVKLDGYSKINHKIEGILRLNSKTGEIVYDNDIFKDETITYANIVGKKSIKGNKYVFIYQGINDDNELEGYNFDVIDLNIGQIIKKNHFDFKDASAYLKFKENSNKLEDRFQLKQKDISIYQDGRVMFLFEKFKSEKNPLGILGAIPIAGTIVASAAHQEAKATDLVMFNFDDNFKLETVNTLKKELTKGYSSDYLFSQYIDNGNGNALFYRDLITDKEAKTKEWKLGIVTVNGAEVKKEEIPMTLKDKFSIQPFPAKEGYILLRESNEEEKYDQIRLERLNY